MADQCIPGCILAALFGLSAIYYLVIKKKGQRANKDLLEARRESVNSIATTSGECRSSNVSDVDVIIVGAGVAGAALAHTLGKKFNVYLKMQDGRQVHIIERDLTEPDRIVGELLQPGGYLKLIELGLEENPILFLAADCVEKIDAQRVFGYALFKDGKHTRLSYPLEKFHSDVAGRSFHNGRFIQRMRDKAASLPKYVFSSIVNLCMWQCPLEI
ncbi:hypothetical protein DKX38_007929 [Salix brachista]|uniref:Squalene monooxygenase n=1 Tax=Salix brachista TaxID=2182728 RepID=A0A5N5MPC0_9ROSI|nr:hypothetical protein DKX38_007929 [Salix brachista]